MTKLGMGNIFRLLFLLAFIYDAAKGQWLGFIGVFVLYVIFEMMAAFYRLLR